jgi:hypothetical protein
MQGRVVWCSGQRGSTYWSALFIAAPSPGQSLPMAAPFLLDTISQCVCPGFTSGLLCLWQRVTRVPF